MRNSAALPSKHCRAADKAFGKVLPKAAYADVAIVGLCSIAFSQEDQKDLPSPPCSTVHGSGLHTALLEEIRSKANDPPLCLSVAEQTPLASEEAPLASVECASLFQDGGAPLDREEADGADWVPESATCQPSF